MQYFDLNYVLGTGSNGEIGYNSPEEILKQMDYLDIDRALVFSAEARDFSGIYGNRKLLDQLKPFADRLFPAFVITSRDYYENGTVEYYRELAKAGTVKAFRIIPGKTRSPIYECEFILEKLAEFSPVIQLDSRELSLQDYQTLAKFAKQFPTIRFVIGQKVWCNLDSILNLMNRCSNVYMDTSWMHVQRTVNLIIDRFGADRLLFATGHKTQYGAAIAALNHAEIPAEIKEQIAHKNAENLLGLKPLNGKLSVPPEFLKQKPLWNKLSHGEPLDQIKIVDAHVHQAPPAMGGYVLPESDLELSLPGMIRTMDKIGIAHNIVIGAKALYNDCAAGNKEIAEKTKDYRSRFHGYWGFNPHQYKNITEELLEKDFADGFFVGFKTLCGYWGVAHDDPRFKVMLEFAEKHALPILIHTWNDVDTLWNVVPHYKNIKFVIAHCGGENSGRKKAIALAKEYNNVYLETCGTFCATMELADAVRELGPERFIFGTDAALHDPAFEMGSFLSMPLPDDILQHIMCESYKKLYKITL